MVQAGVLGAHAARGPAVRGSVADRGRVRRRRRLRQRAARLLPGRARGQGRADGGAGAKNEI